MNAGRIHRTLRMVLPLCGIVNAATATDGAPSVPTELAPFKASYSVVYHGMTAGTSTMALTHSEGERWSYQSSSTPRGLFRLFLPESISQRSDMQIDASGVLPLQYTADGDSDDRQTRLNFDWPRLRVTGNDGRQPVDMPLESGVQDDLSVQVLLMRELIAGRQPETFKTLGHHGVDQHRYVRQGTATLKTPLGELDTVLYRSERIGSSRSSLFWCAPALGYLPVRAQQNKGDKVEFVMELLSFERR